MSRLNKNYKINNFSEKESDIEKIGYKDKLKENDTVNLLKQRVKFLESRISNLENEINKLSSNEKTSQNSSYINNIFGQVYFNNIINNPGNISCKEFKTEPSIMSQSLLNIKNRTKNILGVYNNIINKAN
jgi:hypothetical protein